ncbi:jg25565 [Pararge aegeria aegeria]|uniref:Jg25565 protein n=1 Tax=Pararge aegeria aegeria TaxID=348720 RepID=A0A8S4RXW9_9NEOP|nr:jg25565 [Pararge aegeria aegeria]
MWPHKKASSHSVADGACYTGCISTRSNQNEEIRRRTRVTGIAQQVAMVEGAGMATSQRLTHRWSIPNEVDRPFIVDCVLDFGTPYKGPISSSGHQSVEVILDLAAITPAGLAQE